MTVKHILVKTFGGIWAILRWKNPIREIIIIGIQKRRLSKLYDSTTRSLIIFLTQGLNTINGGILSISWICDETIKLKQIHGAEVVMCTMPGEYLLLKHTKFQNNNYLYSFTDVLSYFQNLDRLLVHIPELYVDNIKENGSIVSCLQQKKIKYLYLNILLQNIEKVPSRESVKRLQKLGRVTCTTAHEAYSTPETEEKIGCPLHKLSTRGGPENYQRKDYSRKENLMVVSPDPHELKSAVLNIIAKQFPKMRLKVIKNMTFEKYKEIISKAKWAITFGEGMDGYFVQTIFSGGISFAVYNNRFFTDDFKTLRTIYTNYYILMDKICLDIRELDNEGDYIQYQQQQFEICAKHKDYKQYVENIVSYYSKYYSNVAEG